ncbi:hypothetical protein [Streptacidiphilus sp. EB103A]|uniref:hypothetical protein n=1 Tax=Streptacidiphilus sp. EB103A TaxID=3156275 RepID=UPI003517C6CE
MADEPEHNAQTPDSETAPRTVRIQPARPRAIPATGRGRTPRTQQRPAPAHDFAPDLEDQDRDEEPGSRSVTIQPARAWPVYEVDHARAELLALQLLSTGYSVFRVAHQTRLSKREVRRLSAIVADEAADPRPPKIVGRSPARPTGAPCRPPSPAPEPAPDEPEQMSLLD